MVKAREEKRLCIRVKLEGNQHEAEKRKIFYHKERQQERKFPIILRTVLLQIINFYGFLWCKRGEKWRHKKGPKNAKQKGKKENTAEAAAAMIKRQKRRKFFREWKMCFCVSLDVHGGPHLSHHHIYLMYHILVLVRSSSAVLMMMVVMSDHIGGIKSEKISSVSASTLLREAAAARYHELSRWALDGCALFSPESLERVSQPAARASVWVYTCAPTANAGLCFVLSNLHKLI